MAKGKRDVTSARWTRADCCKELELLHGHLLTITGKNKQLEALQSHARAREAQTQQTLQRKDDEIFHLKKTVAILKMKLLDQNQLTEAMKVSSPEKPRSASLKLELEALKSRNEALGNNLQTPNKRKTANKLKTQRRATSVIQESTDKHSEIDTTLRANKMLRDKVIQMKKATTKMLNQVEQAQVLMAAMHDQLERYRNVVDGQTLEITQLHAKVKQLEKSKLALEGKILEMDEKKSDGHAFVSDTKAELKLEKAVCIAGLDELRRKLMQREQQKQRTCCQKGNKMVNEEKENNVVRGCASTAVADLEKQFEMLQESRIEDKSTMFELGLQQWCDLKSRVQHLDIDAVIKSAIQATVQNQTAKLECVGQNKPPQERHVKKQLVHGLEIQQDFEEKQLVEARESNANHEQQAGLEGVRKEQKKLGAQLGQEKQMYVELRQEPNQQVEAAGKLQLAKADGDNIALVVVQLSRAQHTIIILKAGESAKRGGELISCEAVVLQDRINQLENELQMQTKHVKELEEARRNVLVSAEKVQSLPIKRGPGVDKKLQNDEALLYEAIDEVEQLIKSLLLECTKYKDIASLALNKRFAQEQGNREHQEKQLRELLSSSEDSATVDELQHQLMQIKVTYQQSDLLLETQQQSLFKNERLDPEMEMEAQELTAVREKSNDKIQILENAICQVNDRGWTKWEAFRKRLDALEDEIQLEQLRLKQLNKDFEDKEDQLQLLDLRQHQRETGQLKAKSMR